MINKIVGLIIGFFFSDQKFLVWMFALGMIACSIVISQTKTEPSKTNIDDEYSDEQRANLSGVEDEYLNRTNIYVDSEGDNKKRVCKNRGDFYINMDDYQSFVKYLLGIFTVGFAVSFFLTYTTIGSSSLYLLKEIGIEKAIFGIVVITLMFLLLLQTSQKVMTSVLVLFISLIIFSYVYFPIEVRQILIFILAFGLVITGIVIEVRKQNEKTKETFLAPPVGPCYQTNGKFGQLYYDKGELFCVGEDGSYQSQKEIEEQMKKKEDAEKLVKMMKSGNMKNEMRKEISKTKTTNGNGNPFGFGVCLLEDGLFGVSMPYFGNKCVSFKDAMEYVGGLTDDDRKRMGILDGSDKKRVDGIKKSDDDKIQSDDCHPKEFDFEQECNVKYNNPSVGLKKIDTTGCFPGFYKGVCEIDYHNGVKLPKGDLTDCYPDGMDFNTICKSIYGSKPENRSTTWGYKTILSGTNGGCPVNYSRAICSQLYNSGKNILGNVSDCVQNWEDNTDACKQSLYNQCLLNNEHNNKDMSEQDIKTYCEKEIENIQSNNQTYNSCIPPFKRAICSNNKLL